MRLCSDVPGNLGAASTVANRRRGLQRPPPAAAGERLAKYRPGAARVAALARIAALYRSFTDK
jgi:hypothetical protein